MNSKTEFTSSFTALSSSSSIASENENPIDDESSSLALRMVAIVTHHENLRMQSWQRWKEALNRREEKRMRLEYFSGEYYRRNICYVLFRAWQWRHERRQTMIAKEKQLCMLQKQRVLRLLLKSWRGFTLQRKNSLAQMEHLNSSREGELRRSYWSKWNRYHSRLLIGKGLKAATEQASLKERWFAWKRFTWTAREMQIRCEAVKLFTTNAWLEPSSDNKQPLRCRYSEPLLPTEALNDLVRRFTWLRWLQVTFVRRACRIQRYAENVQKLQTSVRMECREIYWRSWVARATSLMMSRRVNLSLLRVFSAKWELFARLNTISTVFNKKHVDARRLHVLFSHWKTRANYLSRCREEDTAVERFYNSVVIVNALKEVWAKWRYRWNTRIEAARLKVLAQAARRRLLQDLTLRRIIESVLSTDFSAVSKDLPDIKPASFKNTNLLSVASPCSTSLDVSDRRDRPKVTLLNRNSLRKPIPLRHSQSTPCESSEKNHKVSISPTKTANHTSVLEEPYTDVRQPSPSSYSHTPTPLPLRLSISTQTFCEASTQTEEPKEQTNQVPQATPQQEKNTNLFVEKATSSSEVNVIPTLADPPKHPFLSNTLALTRCLNSEIGKVSDGNEEEIKRPNLGERFDNSHHGVQKEEKSARLASLLHHSPSFHQLNPQRFLCACSAASSEGVRNTFISAHARPPPSNSRSPDPFQSILSSIDQNHLTRTHTDAPLSYFSEETFDFSDSKPSPLASLPPLVDWTKASHDELLCEGRKIIHAYRFSKSTAKAELRELELVQKEIAFLEKEMKVPFNGVLEEEEWAVAARLRAAYTRWTWLEERRLRRDQLRVQVRQLMQVLTKNFRNYPPTSSQNDAHSSSASISF